MKIDKYYLSWQKYLTMCYQLVKTIKKDKNKFRYVIGINRGGLIPALIISHFLNKKLFTITPHLIFQCQPNLKLLVVDDVSDKGKTLSPFTNHLTATLFIKPWTKTIPNYWIKSTKKYIVFPYEKK